MEDIHAHATGVLGQLAGGGVASVMVIGAVGKIQHRAAAFGVIEIELIKRHGRSCPVLFSLSVGWTTFADLLRPKRSGAPGLS